MIVWNYQHLALLGYFFSLSHCRAYTIKLSYRSESISASGRNTDKVHDSPKLAHLPESGTTRKVVVTPSELSSNYTNTPAANISGWTKLTDLSDKRLIDASVYALEQILLGESHYNMTMVVNASTSVQLHIVSAQSQVSFGTNFNVTLAVDLNESCVGAFEVLVHSDLSRNFRVVQWGNQKTCKEIDAASTKTPQAPSQDGWTNVTKQDAASYAFEQMLVGLSPYNLTILSGGYNSAQVRIRSSLPKLVNRTKSFLLELEVEVGGDCLGSFVVLVSYNQGRDLPVLEWGAKTTCHDQSQTTETATQETFAPTVSRAESSGSPSVSPSASDSGLESLISPNTQGKDTPTVRPAPISVAPSVSPAPSRMVSLLTSSPSVSLAPSDISMVSMLSPNTQGTNTPTPSPAPSFSAPSVSLTPSRMESLPTNSPSVSPAPTDFSFVSPLESLPYTEAPAVSPALSSSASSLAPTMGSSIEKTKASAVSLAPSSPTSSSFGSPGPADITSIESSIYYPETTASSVSLAPSFADDDSLSSTKTSQNESMVQSLPTSYNYSTSAPAISAVGFVPCHEGCNSYTNFVSSLPNTDATPSASNESTMAVPLDSATAAEKVVMVLPPAPSPTYHYSSSTTTTTAATRSQTSSSLVPTISSIGFFPCHEDCNS